MDNTIPGYETTYNYHYRYYCPRDQDVKAKSGKNILNLSDLEQQHYEEEGVCRCAEIQEMKKFKCDVKAWDYLAGVKTDYGDKIGSLWAGFNLKALVPTKIKPGMSFDLELVQPEEPPTYIYTLEESEPKSISWWTEKLSYPADLQCRISREFQKRQSYLTEKIKAPKS